MSTLTSTLLPASLPIPGRTKPTNFPNNKVLFRKNDDYLNRIVPQKKKASFCIKAQEQEGEALIPASPTAHPIVRPKFVLFGSSIVEYSFYEGWAATLAHVYARQVDVVLRGYAGWNSRTALLILDKIFPKNAIQQPSLVIVYFGGNDSTPPPDKGPSSHVPLQEYSKNVEKIFKHIQSLSDQTRILFLSTPPINEKQLYGNRTRVPEKLAKSNESHKKYSEEGLKLCKKMNIKAIDLWSIIQKSEDWKDFFVEGIHLNKKGSKVVAKEILKVLEEADWKPSLYWKRMPIEFIEYSDTPMSYGKPNGPDGKPIISNEKPDEKPNSPYGKPIDPYTTRFPTEDEEWNSFLKN